MFFEKKINNHSKEAVANFLLSHFRYDTMNGLIRSTSYANCVKINRLGLSGTTQEKARVIISVGDYWNELSWVIREFEQDMGADYTIGTNGRSAGYLVLYESEYYDPGYKSTCKSCGKLSPYPVSDANCQCGVCNGPRANLKAPLRWTRLKSSSIDHAMSLQDYLEMPLHELKERAALVQAFDRACDRMRDAFIEMANDYMVIEHTVMVPQKVRRLERV